MGLFSPKMKAAASKAPRVADMAAKPLPKKAPPFKKKGR